MTMNSPHFGIQQAHISGTGTATVPMHMIREIISGNNQTDRRCPL